MKRIFPLQSLLFLLIFPLNSVASVQFTKPSPGAHINIEDPFDVEWEYSHGLEAEASQFSLSLCAGGNDPNTYETLFQFVDNASIKDVTSLTARSIDPNLGGDSPNAYFLQFSVDVANGSTMYYSSRFSLDGMTGKFSPLLLSSIEAVSGTTAGPQTFNDLHKRQVPVIPPGADVNAPYAEQTGLTRFAPVPKAVPTKITLKSAPPQFPTSAFVIATTYLPIPSIMTTISQPAPESVTQIENPIAAAPTDDMAKFLRRWED